MPLRIFNYLSHEFDKTITVHTAFVEHEAHLAQKMKIRNLVKFFHRPHR